mgnify:CR=1 FL=1
MTHRNCNFGFDLTKLRFLEMTGGTEVFGNDRQKP